MSIRTKEGEEFALEDVVGFMFGESNEDESHDANSSSSSADQQQEEITIKYDTYFRKHKFTEKIEDVPEQNIVKLALTSRHHSLWAEFVYNAARVLADLIDDNPHISSNLPRINVQGKSCLELGAGAGLPGVIAGMNGASVVVISDYGHDQDLSLIYPIDINIDAVRNQFTYPSANAYGVGYVWGYPVAPLLDPAKYYQKKEQVDLSNYTNYLADKRALRIEDTNISNTDPSLSKFDIIILADLIFNRSEHKKLLWTVQHCLQPGSGVCYVTFSHHDPQKRELDLNFFRLAEQEPYNLTVTYLGEDVRQSYPFREGDGMDEQRGVVYLYTLTIAGRC